MHVRGSHHSQVDERSASAEGILQQEEEEGCVPSSHSQSLGQDPGSRRTSCPRWCNLHQPSKRKGKITLNNKQRTVEPIPELLNS